QMDVPFPQPFIQPPGIGDAPGFPRLPVRLPFEAQTTVLSEFPPTGPIANLSVPGLRVADATGKRPIAPLICRDDMRQTAVNFILGMPGLLAGGSTLPTQLEYAVQRKPTFAIVELGFTDVLDAACAGDPKAIPDDESFRTMYARILRALVGSGS